MHQAQELPGNGTNYAATMQPAYPFDDEEDESFLSLPMLLDYWQAIVRLRLLIAAIIIAALAAGVIITMLTAPTYKARAQIQISSQQQNITNVPGLEQQDTRNDVNFYQTQYNLLKAPSLAQRVAKELHLADDKAFFAAHGIDSTGDMTADEREKLASHLLLDHVAINPINNSSLVDIVYSSQSPAISAKIANAWPQQFIRATIDRQFASTADARNYLQNRLNGLRGKLEQSEHDLITFSSNHDIVALGGGTDAKGNAEPSQTLTASNLQTLNTALIQARADRIAAGSLAHAKVGPDAPEVMSDTTITTLRAQQAETAAEYAKVLVQFEPGYPAARALKSQLDSLDAAIARETARIAGSHEVAYQQALSREKELEAQVKELKASFGQQQRDTIQYNIYQREVDTNRQLYDALLQRYKEIGVAGDVGATNIVVVNRASVPGTPSGPNLPRNVVLALILGLVLAGGAVFVVDQLDDRIRHPGDIERFLEIPLLGNVPRVDDLPLDELHDIKSHLSEAYFSARASLALATSHGLPRTFLVTSAQMGEGKSTTALALAEIIGRTGRRVLLVDADMRSPSVHKLVDSENTHGLSNALAGETGHEDWILPTEWHNVSALPSGPMPPSAAELLSSETLAGLVAGWQEQFDHVILDAPPVLGLADGPLIAHAVEGSVFILEAERTSKRAIRNALHRLQGGNRHVFGAIVTKVSASHRGYGYGYAYSYEYGDRKDAAVA